MTKMIYCKEQLEHLIYGLNKNLCHSSSLIFCKYQPPLKDDDFERLTAVLERNTSVKQLTLCNILINDTKAKMLVNLLVANTCLLELNLTGCAINEAQILILSEALMKNKTLKTINLSDNPIGDKGIETLSNAVKHNNVLSTIDLSLCCFGVEGAKTLAQMLKINRSIVQLSVEDNNITKEGLCALLDMLIVNKTLAFISLRGAGPSSYDSTIRKKLMSLEDNTTLTELEIAYPFSEVALEMHVSKILYRNEKLAIDLIEAVKKGDIQNAKKYIKKASLNHQDKLGNTALHYAAPSLAARLSQQSHQAMLYNKSHQLPIMKKPFNWGYGMFDTSATKYRTFRSDITVITSNRANPIVESESSNRSIVNDKTNSGCLVGVTVY